MLHRCCTLASSYCGKGAGSEITTLPIFAPNRQGLLTGLGVAGWVLPPVVRRGEPVCPGREAGRRASAAGPWMAHRRVPWDKGASRGHPTQEGEQVGEKTFGDFGSFQSHSPSRAAAAKPCRGQRPRVLHGEAVPLRRGAAFVRQCRYPTPHPFSRKGRGNCYPGAMRSAYCTLRLSRKGRGDCYRGRLRFATRPYW